MGSPDTTAAPTAPDDGAASSGGATTALVDRFVDAVWNGEDLGALDHLAHPELVVHHLGAGVDRTRDEFATFHGGLLEAVPDLEHSVRDYVAAEDMVVAFVSIQGTPERQYGALAPTGESFETVGFQQYRFTDGRIAEVWVLPNAMGMLRQLGVFPDSPAAILRLLFGALKARLFGR